MSNPSVVYEFEAGRNTIRASLSRLKGKSFLDLRVWYEPEPGAELKPTQKGICVGVEYAEELQEAVAALATAARQEQPGPRRVA